MTENGTVEVTDCQVCGGSQTRLMFEEAPYRVLRCVPCGLVFVTPRLDDESLRQVYDASYWQSDSPKLRGYADYAGDEPLYLKTFRRRMRLVRRYVNPGSKVLDIGCAAGFFLRVMLQEGHDVYGVEPSAPIAAQAQENFGRDRIHGGTLDDLPDSAGFERHSFDLVSCWDVVEHVPDPQKLLRQVREMLAPNGTLILETQNVDSTFAGMLGRRWQHYKHREHLYHFNPATIERILHQSGFRVVHNTPSYGGKYVSFGFIAERAERMNKVLSWLCKPLALIKRANVYVNLRDEMVVIAKPV
ncbi:MAG: class I SAM-dependent methyltransferase [Planctomycetota bacterium]